MTSELNRKPVSRGRRRLREALYASAAIVLIAGSALGTATLIDLRAPAYAASPTAVTKLAQPAGFADLVAKVRPAVVLIEVESKVKEAEVPQLGLQIAKDSPFYQRFKKFFDQLPDSVRPDHQSVRKGVGSGFFVRADGHLVTNNHVVDGADKITVVMEDGSRHKATVIGRDPKTDLAVLKIDAPSSLTYVHFGDSDTVRVGDWAIAMGSPFGLGGSVTAGIVSARSRDINEGPYDDFLQVDTPINRGNSGGPLFDAAGQVIGVNTAIFSPSGGNIGIGFAIPSNVASTIVDELIQTGTVSRGWLGVHIQPVTAEIADAVGLKNDQGAIIADVSPKSPAVAAGIHQGDVILGLDNTKIKDAKDLARAVARDGEGKSVTLSVWRDGHKMQLTAKLGHMPADEQVASAPQAKSETSKLGLTVAPLGPKERSQLGLDDSVTGVVIVGVAADGPAAEAGLEPGDVVKSVSGKAVKAPADITSQVDDAAKSGHKSVLMLVERNGNDMFIAVPFGAA